jgi:hypothetical protein
VIPNISCEEPHGLIATINVPPNFERELAFDDEAFFDASNIFGQKSKLIIDSIPSYEGAQRTASKLIVICAFGLNELIKLISASRHQQLIVAYDKTNSKIYLIFGEECSTFCEGEWEQQVGSNINLVGYTSRISLIGHIGLVGLISFVGLGFFGVNGLVGVIGLIGPTISLITLASLVTLASFATSISSITLASSATSALLAAPSASLASALLATLASASLVSVASVASAVSSAKSASSTCRPC